jgi:hypothetical protein
MLKRLALVVALLSLEACAAPGVPTALLGDGTSASSGPAVSQAPVVTDVPVVTFSAIALKGTGAKVPKFTIPDGAGAIATFSARGSDNFAVTSLAADGSPNDLLVNVIGSYTGTVLFDMQSGQHSVAFKIETTESWAVTIRPVSSARIWNSASKLLGKGDDVVQIAPSSAGLVTLNITHNGSSNFVVTGYGPNGADLMVNEIGKYSGQVPLADGSFLLTVGADGAWTVTPGG